MSGSFRRAQTAVPPLDTTSFCLRKLFAGARLAYFRLPPAAILLRSHHIRAASANKHDPSLIIEVINSGVFGVNRSAGQTGNRSSFAGDDQKSKIMVSYSYWTPSSSLRGKRLLGAKRGETGNAPELQVTLW